MIYTNAFAIYALFIFFIPTLGAQEPKIGILFNNYMPMLNLDTTWVHETKIFLR